VRLSIWQQFSSNHSVSFTVVGTFETPEAAQKAATELRQVLATIAAYMQERRESPDFLREYSHASYPNETLIPSEEAFKRQYAVEWPYHLDWLPWDAGKAREAVQVYDRLVQVENLGNTYIGQKPMDDLLARLGGAVVYWCEPDTGGYVTHVYCTAPDEITAEAILERVDAIRQSHLYRGLPEGLYCDDCDFWARRLAAQVPGPPSLCC
jgi:hypothetical protein